MHVVSRRARALLTATLTLGLPSAAIAQGWSYTVTTTTQSPTVNGVTLVAKVVGDSTAGRMDIERAVAPGPIAAGDYVIFRPGTMVFVFPARRQYAEIDPMNMTTAALAAAGATMHVSNVRVAAEREGTETLHGQSTRRVKLTQDYALGVDAMGAHQDVSNHVVVELWLADVQAAANPFTNPSLGGRQPGADNPLAELLTKSMAAMKSLGAGFPLKQVTTTTATGVGSSLDIVQTTEVTDLAPASMDPTKLEVPAGYTKVDFASRSR